MSEQNDIFIKQNIIVVGYFKKKQQNPGIVYVLKSKDVSLFFLLHSTCSQRICINCEKQFLYQFYFYLLIFICFIR